MMTRASAPPTAAPEAAAPACMEKRASYDIDSCHTPKQHGGEAPLPPADVGPPTPSQSGEAGVPSAAYTQLVAPGSSARKYRLVRLDEATGLPGRPVTEAEAAQLAALLSAAGPLGAELAPALSPLGPAAAARSPGDAGRCEGTSPARLTFLHHHKPGGPCDHCGASGERAARASARLNPP